MINWCSKHQCFQICPECTRNSRVHDTTASRHRPKIIIESNPGLPPDPRLTRDMSGARSLERKG